MSPVAFAYGQARMQARHGQRPSAEAWRQLDAIGDFAHYVQAVRDTGLRPWILHVGATTGAHEIELAMRERWRRQVQAVAGWEPSAWRAAVRWVAIVVDLPAVQHLLRGEPPPPWLLRDPLLADAAAAPPPAREAALRAVPELAPVVDAWRRGLAPAEAWLRRWNALSPRVSARHAAALSAVQAQARALSAAPEAGDRHERGRSLARLVEPIEHRTARILHQHALTPAAAFAYLLLVWMDCLRLRAGLVRRRLMPPPA